MASTGPDDESSVAEANAAACPAVRALERIGSSWRLIVLYDLLGAGEKRFNELKRSTAASSRTLSRVLDDLEAAGLVDRRVEDRPLATYYSLTERGAALEAVFEPLEAWSEAWLDGEEADAAGESEAEVEA